MEGWNFRAIALTWSRVSGFPGGGRRSSARAQLAQNKKRIRVSPQTAILLAIIFIILQSPFLVNIHFSAKSFSF
jgi:hypothetical protein